MDQVPPTGPYDRPPSESAIPDMRGGPVRFSAAAVAAFVLSLLGCLGITAILGVIFGLIGLSATRGGARRGRGLAIAAIPISIVTGLLSLLMITLIWSSAQTMQVVMKLPDMYGVEGNVSTASLASFREVCTDGFNAEVSEQQLTRWFESVRKRYGALNGLALAGPQQQTSHKGSLVYNLRGKFVSGTENIAVTLRVVPPFSIKIDDMAINTWSPRAQAKGPGIQTENPAHEAG